MNLKWLLTVLLASQLFSGLFFAMELEDEGWVMVEPGTVQTQPSGEKPVAPENLKAYYEKLHNDWAKTAQRYGYTTVLNPTDPMKVWHDWQGYRHIGEFNRARNPETLKDLYSQLGIHGDSQKIPGIKNKLVANYKIHLMPYDDDINVILNRILREASTNPSFKNLIHLFKIKLATRDLKKGDEVLPKIVIYPISGKENAQAFLDKVYELMQDIRGMNIVPRYNEKITDLIYVTQGDGDYKGKAHAEYYEPSFIYYSPTFEGGQSKNYHLKNPALQEWEVIED